MEETYEIIDDTVAMCSLCRGNGIIIVETVSRGMYFASPFIGFKKV